MRIVHDFNQQWLFRPEQVPPDAPDSGFEVVTLPHTNRLFSQRFVDNRAYQFVSTYRKRFSVPEFAPGKRVFVDFEGAMLSSTVRLNGALLGVHQGGYTPFSFELTGQLAPGENVLDVTVDATENPAIPPYGRLVDFLTFGGLYREVSLRVVDTCHITRAFARPVNVLEKPGLECDVQISQPEPGLRLEARLEDAGGRVLARQGQPLTAAQETIVFPEVGPILLWRLEAPTLYTLVLDLVWDGAPVDQEVVRFGFRSAQFGADGVFRLNGAPLKLFGLNRHQTYPYIGGAAPARLQRLDADILKHELGCNIVRTAHYAQSSHFLNRCDEIGLLVFEEIAGWQYIGDEDWQALALQDLEAMILRDRNHPSIILWGVRVNESPDHNPLYARTNALAHALDPTRQTGGVRDFIESHQLEDVFTLNDFNEGLREPRTRPHLVTEFVGHMFPAKAWDHEERRVEHALRHARKHDLYRGHPDVAGAIGWCAFDYHTHKEFGSGDRVCYHGVMDMFRLPKLAAAFYRSQKSPADEIVLQAATNWTMGDRSGGGNNPLVVFSNCDEIEVFIGEESQGRFAPDWDGYPHLAHPPFIVRWPEPYNPWGTAFSDLTVVGTLAGQRAAAQTIAADHVPDRLVLGAHTAQLVADGADMARITVQIVDRYGNVLPYQLRVVNFSLEGDAQLIGENPLPLFGGQGACFIRAGHSKGTVTLTARADDLPAVSLTLALTQPS
ncbi:MAG: glycoside hydrolase family 2 protein [Anaerolineae bacterium]|nr:glycoside hydrolase family 2 protein [Anaerolineae bacterium]